MARRFATRIGAIPRESILENRFAGKTIFTTFEQFARIASNMRFARNPIRKERAQFGNPQALSEAFYADAVRSVNLLTLAFALYFPAFLRP